jgi:hypothetical protein
VSEVSPRAPLKVRANLTFGSSLEAGSVKGKGLKADSVSSTLDFGSSVTRGGVDVGTNFGVEVPTTRIDNVTWSAAGGVATISARIFVASRWDTANQGRTDIAGPDDSDVTSDSWDDVVADLTPNASGRPRRTDYWAQDLTARHERFHSSDDIGRARAYVPTAQTWLNGQTIAAPVSEARVRALLDTVRSNVAADMDAYYSAGGEDRAYADGQASYQARADGVGARATREGWR